MEIEITDTLCQKFYVKIWRNQWYQFSAHRYKSDAEKVKKVLEEKDIKAAREYVKEMDVRINKIIAPYYLN